MSAPVQVTGFLNLGSGFRACWDRGLGTSGYTIQNLFVAISSGITTDIANMTERKILRYVISSFHMVTDSGVQELDLNGTGREKMLGQCQRSLSRSMAWSCVTVTMTNLRPVYSSRDLP